jgi:hypothetical protein
MTPTIATWHPWHRRVIERAREFFFAPREVSMHELDRRTLADIGVDPSEIGSIESEARGRARPTRLRIVVGSGAA